jgi:hypothetical protein
MAGVWGAGEVDAVVAVALVVDAALVVVGEPLVVGVVVIEVLVVAALAWVEVEVVALAVVEDEIEVVVAVTSTPYAINAFLRQYNKSRREALDTVALSVGIKIECEHAL